MLWMYQRVIFGETRNPENKTLADLNRRERLVLAPIIALVFVMGIYPSLFLSRSEATVKWIRHRVEAVRVSWKAE
jgi:NADH-quinone oxidoreductase subunit M